MKRLNEGANMGKTWVHNTGNSISIPPDHTRGRFKLGLNLRVRHSVNCINIFRPNMLEGHARKSERASPVWQVMLLPAYSVPSFREVNTLIFNPDKYLLCIHLIMRLHRPHVILSALQTLELDTSRPRARTFRCNEYIFTIIRMIL